MDTELSFTETLRRNPYRLFFPMGIIVGLLGVGHWALWTVGIPVDHIKLLHVSLQSQGFLAFFVVGFLMTALPRFSGTAPATGGEIAFALCGGLIFLSGAMGRHWIGSQVGFLLMLATIPFFALRRVMHRTKEVPPSFLLLGFGLIHATLGAIFSMVSHMGADHFYLFFVGRQMVQVGFLLCMVLGITAKLAPFLMGYTAEPGCEVGPSLLQSPASQMIVHGVVGAILLGSFFLEPVAPRLALGIRAAVCTVHLLWFAKIGRPLKKRTTTIVLFWLSCWMIVIGSWLTFAFPVYRVAALHVIFIGGFSLMIFSFGLLVVLSHSGKAALLNGKLWVLKSIGCLALFAMLLRVLSDLIPAHYMILLHSASGFWVLAALVWLVYVLPKMRGVHHEH